MARYFIHVRDYGRDQHDDEGIDLPNIDAAIERAILAARSLMSKNIMDGRLILSPSIAITCEDGKELATLPFLKAIDTVYVGSNSRLAAAVDALQRQCPQAAIQRRTWSPREPRLRCALKAHMRVDGSSVDIKIRNISCRGMLIQAESPPKPGARVEIKCPNKTVAAKVVWVSHRRFGVQTDEAMDINAIMGDGRLVA